MDTWWRILVAVAASSALLWFVLVAALYVVGRKSEDPVRLRDALTLIPDVVRLLRRLATDKTHTIGVRIRVWLLLLYLLLPVDLIPDFIPVVGYVDDIIIIVFLLRSITRVAGTESLDRHWPGTAEGLLAIKRLARLPVN